MHGGVGHMGRHPLPLRGVQHMGPPHPPYHMQIPPLNIKMHMAALRTYGGCLNIWRCQGPYEYRGSIQMYGGVWMPP